MNEVVDVASYLLYKRIAWGIDVAIIAFYFALTICVLLQKRESEKRGVYAFLFTIFVSVLLVVCNLICWSCFSIPEKRETYEFVATISVFLSTVIFVSISLTINHVISHKAKYNMKFYNVMYALIEVTAALVFVPSIRSTLFTITENSIMVTHSGFVSYYILTFTYMLICCIYGFKKIKEIGTRDSIVIFIFALMPFTAAFLNGWYRTAVAYLLTALGALVLYCVSYQSRLQVLDAEKSKKDVELVNIQKTLLLNQIKPHFIYNSLSTIKYLCETDPEQASKLCDSFSSFLRANIDSIDNAGLIDINKEIENCENYLKIEQARFGKRVKYQLDIKCSDFCVPVLSIETILENAVKHGICQKKEGGTITISTYEDDNYYFVKVEDDGIGFEIEGAIDDSKNHAGMQNTTKRFRLELDADVIVDSKIGVGTSILIKIPKED